MKNKNTTDAHPVSTRATFAVPSIESDKAFQKQFGQMLEAFAQGADKEFQRVRTEVFARIQKHVTAAVAEAVGEEHGRGAEKYAELETEVARVRAATPTSVDTTKLVDPDAPSETVHQFRAKSDVTGAWTDCSAKKYVEATQGRWADHYEFRTLHATPAQPPATPQEAKDEASPEQIKVAFQAWFHSDKYIAGGDPVTFAFGYRAAIDATMQSTGDTAPSIDMGIVAWRYRTKGGNHWQATTDRAVAGTLAGGANVEVRPLVEAATQSAAGGAQ